MAKFLKQNWILIFILAISAWLRFADLGRQSFWLDEAESAIVAAQPTLEKSIEVIQMHTAAMPLDYLVIWGMGRISLSEGWLRIPIALWGIAGVWVVYSATKKIGGKAPALITAGLLALAPAHIYLSQELRYYAALFFFYWLLTGLLFTAQKQPTWQNWGKVIAIATLGAYFHLYTVLAFANGLFFLLLRYEKTHSWRSALLRLFASGILTALLVLPGFLYFSMEGKLNYVIEWDMASAQIMIALGWFPVYASRIGYTLGFLLLLITLAGMWLSFRDRKSPLFALILSAGLQIVLITLADVINNYFIAWRQYYVLLPVSFAVIGAALTALFQRSRFLFVKANSTINAQPANRFLAGFILSVILALSLWTSLDNRQFVKSNAREIAYQLHQTWQPGDQFWTIPAYETRLYRFYFDVLQDQPILSQMKGVQWKEFSELAAPPGKIYLSLKANTLTWNQLEYLKSNRFELINDINNPQLLWVRSQ